jgi:hypothetical protein
MVMFSRKVALPTMAVMIAAAVITGSATSASAGGPSDVCTDSVGYSQVVPVNNSVIGEFAYSGQYLLNGELSQNAYAVLNPDFTVRVIQNSL